MGCDIHWNVEIQDSDGKWLPIDNGDVEYDGRNYQLFSILADVRNGFGFAGVDTGNKLTPIAPPRGIPEDAHQSLKEDAKWLDAHSRSWFTLKELLEVDWDGQVATRWAYVSEKEYIAFRETGKVGRSCGDIFGANISKVDPETMDNIIATAPDRGGPIRYYVKIEWQQTYRECVGSYFFETLEGMKQWAPDGDTSRIRAVFWFDN